MFHMERRKYGRGAWWEQMGVRWRGRWTRRHWVCAEKGWCMLIAFFAAEQCDKGPADGSHWPTVTPEEMRCYNNDILRHKASVFSRLCTATSPMATLYVVLSHSNSHCRCIQIVYCIAWILQSSLCSSTTTPLHPMFVSERIFAYLPPNADGFCRRTLGNVKPTPRASHWQSIVFTQLSKAFVNSVPWELNNLSSPARLELEASFRGFSKWRHL